MYGNAPSEYLFSCVAAPLRLSSPLEISHQVQRIQFAVNLSTARQNTMLRSHSNALEKHMVMLMLQCA